MRFSIIIPVYNVEKYIRKCLESLKSQTFNDYEVIIINDGTKDNSQEIIDEFVKKEPERFKSFIKENGGLSDARNYGIEKAAGEYLVFLDADDYIDENYLELINKKINEHNKLDLIRIPIRTIQENGKIISEEKIEEKNFSGEELFLYLRSKKICIEPAWTNIVKRSYWLDNKFLFPKGMLHEDFAIVLLVILNAKKTSIIKNTYYNYIIRQNSIMTDKSYENDLKKVSHKRKHYDYIKLYLEKNKDISEKAKECCLEYISTALCMNIKKLKKHNKKNYQNDLKRIKILKNIKINSIRNIIKKVVFFFWINV